MNDKNLKLVLASIENLRNDISEKFDANDEKLKSISNTVTKIKHDHDEKLKSISSIVTKIKHDHDEKFKSISNTVTIIEHDHGEKLDALWDAFVGNEQKHKTFENTLEIHDENLYKHNLRIEILEEKIS